MSARGFDATGLREQIPVVVGVLVRRGADFASAEDAVQTALMRALDVWPDDPPRDPRAWLVTVAWRAFIDQVRSDGARTAREHKLAAEPEATEAADVDDTLALYFLCAHPLLTESAAVALTLRAVAGLTTREIAEAYLVPEATMAQRISRAKARIAGVRLDTPGDVSRVLRTLYLMFTTGYSGAVDLAVEAIRVTRALVELVDDPEVSGLLALMLLHHARRAARTSANGAIVPLDEQDRSAWDTVMIAEGVDLLQRALAHDRRGQFQMQAAVAALHADAPRAAQTDWPQIVQWYDELLALTESPVVAVNRAVAVGQADGPRAGLAALARIDPATPRHRAAEAYFLERAGEADAAAEAYAEAARRATNAAERDHLAREAARLGDR